MEALEEIQENAIRKENKITEGVIWKQLLLFFFPMLLGMFFQQLYNTMDAIVVGRYVGKIALSAVGGTTGTLTNVFIGFFVGLSSGATVIISQLYGAKKEKEVGKAVHTAFALAVTAGILIMIVGMIGAPYALRAMHTPEDVIPYSLLFLRIYLLGMVPNLIYNMGAGILRAIGDSKRPLYFLIVSCLVNIVLDFVFVLGFHMGVAGVAIATTIAQVCSAILVCAVLIRTREPYHLDIRKIRFHSNILTGILRIGLPAGFQSLMYTVSNVIIQASINRFGTDTMAAWTAYGKMDGAFWMTISAFGVAITTFVGQNYGARKNDRVRKGVRTALGLSLLVTLVLSTLLYLFGIDLFRLFTSDETVIATGLDMLHFLVPTYVTYICIEIFSGALRGMGNSFIPMLLTGMGVCAFRVIWILLAVPVWPQYHTVIISYPLTWATTSVLFFLYYQYYVRKNKIGIGRDQIV